MPRNGAGVFTLAVGYEATDGATATAAQHNDPLEDLESDMNTPRPIVAGGTGAATAAAARSNLGITGLLGGSSAINPNLGTSTKYDGTMLDGRPLTANESATLAGGFDVTPEDAGTKTTGTFTPDPAENNFQYAINGGAHTLAPPASDCTMIVLYTNNASAGAITTSGYDRVDGSFTTTDTHQFMCFITVVNGVSLLAIKGMQ